MDAIQHKVISLLEGLSARFPSIYFTYGYDATACQHLVNVEPTELYQSEAYMLAEADVYDAWDAVYPNIDLVFVSNNSHHRVIHPLFSITSKVEVQVNESVELVSEPLLVTSEAPQPTMQAAEMYGYLKASQFKVSFGRPAVTQTVVINNGEVGVLEAGAYNYAMAA